MKKVNRKDAIKLITEKKISLLLPLERESVLLNWWDIDEDDKEFYLLSKELREELSENDEPTFPYSDPRYDELLEIAITYEYLGVSNEFLEYEMDKYKRIQCKVDGRVERLEPCPCCKLKTLRELYDAKEGTGYCICPHCGWEDDGTTDISKISSANRGSINEYREKLNKKTPSCKVNKWQS
ncbi:CPCC family cysteine-rich protein [Zooshikella ganghwensis]|uniref:CPCC family cysteine-rich protein n=1 Tax=Zooshikella ganghwensis TaxID=202772 RepID=UPI00068520B0|nr:CPCC family cysteine-rich protein [Zooshikella ganghwensis]